MKLLSPWWLSHPHHTPISIWYIEVRILLYIANSEAVGTDEIAQGRCWDSCLGHATTEDVWILESWKTKPKNCRTIIKSVIFFTTHFWRCQDRQADHDWQVFTNLIMCFIALNAATLNTQCVGLQLEIFVGRWYEWYDAIICYMYKGSFTWDMFKVCEESRVTKAETDRIFFIFEPDSFTGAFLDHPSR